jgi:hypothetical protein
MSISRLLFPAKAAKMSSEGLFAGLGHARPKVWRFAFWAELARLPDPDSPHADDLEAVLEAPGPKHRERERELAEGRGSDTKGR